jgi:hypothetical protein
MDTAASLASRFVRSAVPHRGFSNGNYETINFIQAEVGYVADTSDVEIAWPGDGAVIQTALIEKESFGKGETKMVFKASYYFTVQKIHCRISFCSAHY